MDYKIISFYLYTPLKDPEKLRDLLREICQRLKSKGRILTAEEGINGALSFL